MGKRLNWIDSLRGFSVFCVTIGHLACEYSIEKHIYTFHIFLFFFLSGYLHRDEDCSVAQYLVKKIKTILIPFLCWNLLSAILEICFVGYSPGILKELILLKGRLTWNAPIWFLWILFLTEVVYGMIKKKVPYGNLICIILSVLIGYQISETRMTMLVNLLPISVLAYALGNLFCQNSEKIFFLTKRKRVLYPLLIVLMVANQWFGVEMNSRIIYTVSNFGNFSYFLIAAVSGTLFYLLLFRNFKWLATSKTLCYIGRRTLNIMTLQYVFFTLYDSVSRAYFDYSLWKHPNTLKAFYLSCFTIFVICALTEGIKKLEKKHEYVFRLRTLLGIR